MIYRFPLKTAVLAIIFVMTLSACGQMGALSLPDQNVNGAEDQSDEENER
jgi:predicted small lipoprotein YifL